MPRRAQHKNIAFKSPCRADGGRHTKRKGVCNAVGVRGEAAVRARDEPLLQRGLPGEQRRPTHTSLLRFCGGTNLALRSALSQSSSAFQVDSSLLRRFSREKYASEDKMASSAANPTTIESRYARLCAEVAGAAAAGANSAESGVPTLAGGEGAARTPSPPAGAAALAPNLPPSASAGMDMINEMFQKQARRLEAQLLQQAQDRKMLELAQTQLMILQQEVARHQSSNAQLQQRVTMSDDSVRLVRSQVDAMRENQQQARHTRRAIPAQFVPKFL